MPDALQVGTCALMGARPVRRGHASGRHRTGGAPTHRPFRARPVEGVPVSQTIVEERRWVAALGNARIAAGLSGFVLVSAAAELNAAASAEGLHVDDPNAHP